MHRIPLLLLFVSIYAGADGAASFAASLKNAGPSFHGEPLRETKLTDLDGDGVEEVLLHLNRIEESSIGLLNTELFDTFTWIDIYKLKNGSYELATKEFPNYLKHREVFYRNWIMKIKKTENFSRDSSSVIEANHEHFIAILNEYLSRIENYNEA